MWIDIKQGENIDLYLTLIVALVLAGLNVLGIGQAMTGSITLAVLALLALSSLVNRKKLEETVERLSRNQDVLLKKFPEHRQENIAGAKELWLIGLILNKTINENDSLLRRKLKQGDRIRVLVVNPNSPFGELISRRKLGSDSLKDIQEYQKLILSKLCSIRAVSPPNMEIRTTDYPPFFGAIAMDLESIEGAIYIEHYSYKMDDLPKMVFQQGDTQWFQHYRDQIMQMWNDANEWNAS
jgi:hypothetical protein